MQTESEVMEQGRQHLQSYLGELLDTISKSAPTCPPVIRAAFRQLFQRVGERFPEHQVRLGAGTLVKACGGAGGPWRLVSHHAMKVEVSLGGSRRDIAKRQGVLGPSQSAWWALLLRMEHRALGEVPREQSTPGSTPAPRSRALARRGSSSSHLGKVPHKYGVGPCAGSQPTHPLSIDSRGAWGRPTLGWALTHLGGRSMPGSWPSPASSASASSRRPS